MNSIRSKGEFVRFCIIEAVYFAIFANYSYQSVLLKEIGISSSEIGLITSIASIVGLIACLVWGTISDYLGSAKKVFMIVVTCASLLYTFLPLISRSGRSPAGILFVYIPLIFIFKQSGTSMMDSWIAGSLLSNGIPYGKARIWGSVGYAIMSAVWGAVVGVFVGTDMVFYSFIPLMIFFNIMCVMQRGNERAKGGNRRGTVSDEEKRSKKGTLRLLFKNKAFLIYMVYAFGLNIYIAVSIVFMPYILESANCEPEQVGIVTGFRAIIEVCAMLLGTRLAKRFPLKYIMILPGISFGIEHLCYQFAGSLGNMLCIMVFSGIAGGLGYSIGPSYIYEIVPEEVKSRAQSFNAMNLTFMAVIGTAVGGYVIDSMGVNFLTTACGVLIMALTAFFALNVLRTGRNKSL